MFHELTEPSLLNNLKSTVGESPCLIWVKHDMSCGRISVQEQAFTDV